MTNSTKINQESIYQFLLSPEFKTWFLDRFEGGKTQQPYNQFAYNFSRFLELKGTDQKFHFKLENMMHSLQVTSTGKLVLILNDNNQISGYVACPLPLPAAIFS